METVKLTDAADIDKQPTPNPKAIDYTPVFLSRRKQRENKIVINSHLASSLNDASELMLSSEWSAVTSAICNALNVTL